MFRVTPHVKLSYEDIAGDRYCEGSGRHDIGRSAEEGTRTILSTGTTTCVLMDHGVCFSLFAYQHCPRVSRVPVLVAC
jgi:hypothetical protein